MFYLDFDLIVPDLVGQRSQLPVTGQLKAARYLRHHSEGLSPGVQRDGAPGDAVDGNVSIGGGETQKS